MGDAPAVPPELRLPPDKLGSRLIEIGHESVGIRRVERERQLRHDLPEPAVIGSAGLHARRIIRLLAAGGIGRHADDLDTANNVTTSKPEKPNKVLNGEGQSNAAAL